MTNHGDDCYFFYYSTCTKGDSCPFRHCEAAMGNETVCNLWQEQRCYRTVCKFRHMEITKNRKEIPCYWENQPAGCQKPHCAFLHEKARFIDGIFVPPDKSLSKKEEQPLEEPVPPPPAPLPTAANPHIRGVIKTETQEPVPSPTHPPVVINPADDDEDEDDQFSEEGEDGKVGPSPRKQITKPDDSLNFGVSTLEEIRLRKALKASMKRAGYPIQSGDASANGEKENIRLFFRPASQESSEGTGQPKGNVAGRLGKKISVTGAKSGEGIVLKRSLAERLGKFVDEEEPLMPSEKAMKPIKERLGIPSSLVAPSHPAETNVEPKTAPEQIRIKTLEEIRREKAAKSLSQSQNDGPSVVGVESTKTVSTKATKGVKRAIVLRDDLIGHVKTSSEILPAKKKRQEDQQEQKFSPQRARHAVEKAPSKSQAGSNAVRPVPEATNVGEVRVKTLEEIRREKAARLEVQQALEQENKKSSDTEENGAEKPFLRRINKLASQTGNVITEKSAEVTLKPVKTASHEISPATSKNVKVKTLAEIMQEKHLRRQEMEERGKTSPEAEPSQKHTICGTVSRKTLARDNLVSTCSLSPSSAALTPDSTPSTQRLPAPCKLKSKAAKPLNSTKIAANTAVTSVPVKESSSAKANKPYSQSPSSSREVPDKNKRNSTAVSPAKQPKIAPQGPTAEPPIADTTVAQKKSLDHITDTKVRPKLNVKPSVMKPAVQVKPGQKRKGTQRSAVAAVKPLNSASTELKESLQEIACSDQHVLPSSSSEGFTISPSLTTLPDSSSSPLREQLQTVPVFRQSESQDSKQVINGATSRPVLKTPTQSKMRRLSTASRNTSTSGTTPCTSAGDDFEDLINEFTDDHLEEDIDPAIGEDDLLQELSQMIDS